jgi:hypothetical protein
VATNQDPTESDAITAYLRPWREGDRTISYLTAAIRDAQTAFDTTAAYWLASVGYLIAVEQIGHTVVRQGTSNAGGRAGSREAFVAAIDDFGDPPIRSDTANALYDMRCALAHEFGLRNKPFGNWAPRVFTLQQEGPLVELPTTDWDGTVEGSGKKEMTTIVNVRAAREYVEKLVARLRMLHEDQQEVWLVPGVTPAEIVGLMAFKLG